MLMKFPSTLYPLAAVTIIPSPRVELHIESVVEWQHFCYQWGSGGFVNDAYGTYSCTTHSIKNSFLLNWEGLPYRYWDPVFTIQVRTQNTAPLSSFFYINSPLLSADKFRSFVHLRWQVRTLWMLWWLFPEPYYVFVHTSSLSYPDLSCLRWK